MKPDPNQTVGCVNCQEDFDLPYPPTDSIYVPKCPQCGRIVDGYQDAADLRKRNSEASKVCEQIEADLETIIRDSKTTREQVPEGTFLVALQEMTENLHNLSQHAVNKTEELIENNQ